MIRQEFLRRALAPRSHFMHVSSGRNAPSVWLRDETLKFGSVNPLECFRARRWLSSFSREQEVTFRDYRPRRSLFSVPGAESRKIQKAQTLGADAVVLDLEDGVPFDKKDDARSLVEQTLRDPSVSFGTSELCVRINGLDTGELALRDLEAILPCQRLQSIVVPKVESASDIRFLEEKIASARNDDRGDAIRILAAIESTRGILNLREIAESSSGQHLDALIFASEDYCADVEAIRTTEATELLFARSKLVTTAKAYGLQAIDMVHINFRDLAELDAECANGRRLGFTGKQAIHPNQIQAIHERFAPSPEDVEFATRAVTEYKATTAAGKGACVVDGIVVDLPVYKWARKICWQAKAFAQKQDRT